MKILDLIVDSEMQSFNKSGTLFYISSKTYASPKTEKKEELYEAIKNNGFGELVKETINAKSLAAFVNEQMEENEDELPEWLKDKVNVFEKTSVRMRKTN